MEFKNLLSTNLLLIAIGLVFVVAPACYINSITSSYDPNSAENTMFDGIIQDFFHKDSLWQGIGLDNFPIIDEKADDLIALPAGISPNLLAKYMAHQAVADYEYASARNNIVMFYMVILVIGAIGIVAILLGISLFSIRRKLDMILGEKEMVVKEASKETKRKSIIDWDGKTNWKLVAVMLVVAVLIGIGLVVYINRLPKTVYNDCNNNGGRDGMCDNAANGICDPDCPLAPEPYADPDCTDLPSQSLQKSQNNLSSVVPANTGKTEVIIYQPHRDGAAQYQTISGDCWIGSEKANRTDAYRCMSGNEISDPCFVLPNEKLLICGVDITTGKGGFLLQPMKELPAGALWPNNIPGWAMQVQLASGETCSVAGGATVDIKGNRLNYQCGGGLVIYGDLTVSDVWKASVANLELDATTKEWRTISTKIVDIAKVWQ
jgi:hypothetical protein